MAEPSSVFKTQKTKPGAAWTTSAAVKRLERVHPQLHPLCLRARSPATRALVTEAKKKTTKQASALCLLPSPDSPLLVKREDGRRCAFLKNLKQYIWAPRGKRGAAELARSAQPTGGVSPSLLSLVRLKLGSVSAQLQMVRFIKGTGAGARREGRKEKRPRGKEGPALPQPTALALEEGDEERERGRETRRTAWGAPSSSGPARRPPLGLSWDTFASRVPASETPAPHSPSTHTERLHVTGPPGSPPQPRALDSLTRTTS